jgi:hypothetical protein
LMLFASNLDSIHCTKTSDAKAFNSTRCPCRQPEYRKAISSVLAPLASRFSRGSLLR